MKWESAVRNVVKPFHEGAIHPCRRDRHRNQCRHYEHLYVVKRHEYSRIVSSTTRCIWDVLNQTPLIFAEESVFFVLGLNRQNLPFKSKQMKT